MRSVSFWKKLLNLFSRGHAPVDVVIRPSPSVVHQSRYRLATYEIPLNENYGDC